MGFFRRKKQEEIVDEENQIELDDSTEDKVEKAKEVVYKFKAMTNEDMFNSLSDRMDKMEVWARQLSFYLKNSSK